MLDLQQQLDSILAAVQAAPQLLPQAHSILLKAGTDIARLKAIEDLSAEPQAAPFPAAEGDKSLARKRPFIEQSVGKSRRAKSKGEKLSGSVEKWVAPPAKKKQTCMQVLQGKAAKENKVPKAPKVCVVA